MTWTNVDALRNLYEIERARRGFLECDRYLEQRRIGLVRVSFYEEKVLYDKIGDAFRRRVGNVIARLPVTPPPVYEITDYYEQHNAHVKARKAYKNERAYQRWCNIEYVVRPACYDNGLHELEDSLYPGENDGQVYPEVEPATWLDDDFHPGVWFERKRAA